MVLRSLGVLILLYFWQITLNGAHKLILNHNLGEHTYLHCGASFTPITINVTCSNWNIHNPGTPEYFIVLVDIDNVSNGDVSTLKQTKI